MEPSNKSVDNLPDNDFFNNVKTTVEKGLDNMKKIVNNINQMRVEASYLESDMLMTIDASTWEDISELIGPATMKVGDFDVKKEA